MRFSRKTQSPSLTFKICFPSVLITVAVLVLWLLLQEKICKGGERRSELQGQRAIWNSLEEWWEPGATWLSGIKHEAGSFWAPFQVKRKKSQGCIFCHVTPGATSCLKSTSLHGESTCHRAFSVAISCKTEHTIPQNILRKTCVGILFVCAAIVVLMEHLVLSEMGRNQVVLPCEMPCNLGTLGNGHKMGPARTLRAASKTP